MAIRSVDHTPPHLNREVQRGRAYTLASPFHKIGQQIGEKLRKVFPKQPPAPLEPADISLKPSLLNRTNSAPQISKGVKEIFGKKEPLSNGGRGSIEALRFSIEPRLRRISPSDTPIDDSLDQLLTREGLKDPEFVAEQLINVDLFKNGTEKIVSALIKCWSAFMQDLRVEKNVKYQWGQCQQFYKLLVLLSTYDKGIPLVCAYVKHFPDAEQDKEIYIEHITQQIYQKHAEKQIFFATLPLITSSDLQEENPQTLFRNTTLTSKLCQLFLNEALGPTLENPLNSLKKHLIQDSSKLISLFDMFLTDFYKIQIPEEVKELVKIRQQAITKRFTVFPDVKVDQEVQKGINQLLFLSFINPFLINNAVKENNCAVLKNVTILTKLIQKLANQEPFNENSAEHVYNPLYEQFKDQHQKFIANLLN